MTLPNISEDKLRDILKHYLTPSLHIATPERLYGREKKLTQITRALNSPGRHIFIHGDRGVGKTSLAMTAALLQQDGSEEPLYVLCGTGSTFSDIISAIGKYAVPAYKRFETSGASTAGATVAGFGLNFGERKGTEYNIGEVTDINSALDIVRYIISRRTVSPVIVIDELERINSQEDKIRLSEFINSISSAIPEVKMILSGIGQTVGDLLGAHQSAFRKLELVELERLRHDELWKIISTVAYALGVEVSQETLIRIGQISDGFPHYVHLLGESMFWAMYDDQNMVSKCGPDHYKAGIKGALERTEAEHKSAYQKATQKTKNTTDYEHALWALADHSNLRRQLSSIYDQSYMNIARQLGLSDSDRLNRTQFNDRLLRLRSESHGNVLSGHGAGWFSYRENILRGYVRLIAEDGGVKLARDNYISE